MTTSNSNQTTTSEEKVLVNFHIGRGGHFNNPRHLKFVGVGTSSKSFVEEKGIIKYDHQDDIISNIEDEEKKDEVYDLITDLNCQTEGDDYDAFCKKYGDLGKLALFSDSGNCIGDYEDGAYHYDVDGIYDTSYGYFITSFHDLKENEQAAVLKAQNNYELGYAIGIDFEKRFQIRNEENKVLESGSNIDDLKYSIEEMEEENENADVHIYDSILEEEI